MLSTINVIYYTYVGTWVFFLLVANSNIVC